MNVPHDVTARRPGETLSQWHSRHRPHAAEVAWLQVGLLHVTVCFVGPVLLLAWVQPVMLFDPGSLIAAFALGIWNLLMLAPGMLVALSCDLGPFRWVRGAWALGSLGLAVTFLPFLAICGEVMMIGPVLVWPAVVFVMARPWRRYQRPVRT